MLAGTGPEKAKNLLGLGRESVGGGKREDDSWRGWQHGIVPSKGTMEDSVMGAEQRAVKEWGPRTSESQRTWPS